MIITFISSEDSAYTVRTKSNNIEIMMDNETDCIVCIDGQCSKNYL